MADGLNGVSLFPSADHTVKKDSVKVDNNEENSYKKKFGNMDVFTAAGAHMASNGVPLG